LDEEKRKMELEAGAASKELRQKLEESMQNICDICVSSYLFLF
jgi:hypothetical protein